MNQTTDTASLTTQLAVDAIAYERAPRRASRRVNYRIICADGFKVSVQASEMHYATDSHPTAEAPYWRDTDAEPIAHPFREFEIGSVSKADVPSLDEWDSDGVWAWVPRDAVVGLLDSHGGAVAWEVPA